MYSKHHRCFQTLKDRVSSSGGAASLSCQPAKDFLIDGTLCQCGSLNVESMTTNREFLT